MNKRIGEVEDTFRHDVSVLGADSWAWSGCQEGRDEVVQNYIQRSCHLLRNNSTWTLSESFYMPCLPVSLSETRSLQTQVDLFLCQAMTDKASEYTHQGDKYIPPRLSLQRPVVLEESERGCLKVFEV